jgi:TP901 family phage tail tape measure protein
MSTIAKMLVGLGLDASDYSGGVSRAIADTTAMVDAIDGIKAPLDQSNTALDASGGFAKKAADGFDAFSNIATGALRRVGELAVDTAMKVGSALLDQGKQAIMAAGEYQTMENVFEATSGASAEQMQRMGALALKLGDDISLPGASAKSAAEAMIELNRRGIDIENSFSGARGVLELSAAANISVTESARIGANVLDIYGKKGEELGRVNDQLVNTFKSTGVSVQDQAGALEQVGTVMNQLHVPLDQTLAMIGEMGKKGIEGTKAGTELRGAFMSLMNPSAEAKQSIADLGVTIYDTGGKMKSPIELIEQFSKVQVGSQVTMRMTSDELEKIGKKADTTRDQISKLSDKNADLADKMTENAAKLPKAIEAFTTKRIQAEEDYHDRLLKLSEDADQKREDLARSFTSKLQDIETGHHDKLLALTDQAAQKRTDIENAYGQKRSDLAAAYGQKIQDIESSYQQSLIDMADQADQKRLDLQTSYGRKLQDLAAAHEGKITDIVASFQGKRTDAAENYHESLERLAQSHEDKLASIRQKGIDTSLSYLQQQEDRARSFADQIAGIERSTANKQQDTQENYQNSQADNTESHQEKLADLQTDYQRKAQDLQGQLNGDLTDAQRASIERRLAEARTSYDRAVADEATRYSRQEADAKTHYDRQLEQLQQQHDREVAEAQIKAAEEQRQADEAYARQQAALALQKQAEDAAYAQQRTDAQTAYQNKLTDLQTQLQAALGAEQATYTEQQAAAQTAYARRQEDLVVALQRQQDAATEKRAEALVAAQQSYVDQQATAQAAHDRQVADLQTTLDRQNAAEQTAYATSRQQAQESYDQQLAAVQTNLDRQTTDVDAAYTKQEQRAKQAYDTSFADLSASVTKRQGELDKEMASNQTALTSAQTLLAGYDKDIATHGAHVVTLTQQMRDEALATIFGKENMSAANIVLAGGVEQYQNLTDKINVTGSAQKLAEATTKGLDGAWAGLTNTWETLQLELGKEGLPVATRAIAALTQYIVDHKGDIKAFVSESIIPLAEKIVAVAKGFAEAGDKTAYLKQQVEANSGPIVTAIGDIAVKAAAAIGANAPAIGTALLDGLAKGLNDKWGNMGGTGVVTLLTGGLLGALNLFWGIASPSTKMAEIGGFLIDGLRNGFTNGINGVLNAATNMGMGIKDKLLEWMGGMHGAGRDLANSVFQGLSDTWNNLRQRVTDLWNQIPQGLRDALGMHSPSTVLVALGAMAGQSVVIGAEQMIGAVASAGQGLGAALAGGVGPLALDGSVNGGGSAPSVGGANVSANTSSAVGRGGDTYNIAVQTDPTTNPATIWEKVRQGINEVNRRNGRAEI